MASGLRGEKLYSYRAQCAFGSESSQKGFDSIAANMNMHEVSASSCPKALDENT
jgi:hypothetical protein